MDTTPEPKDTSGQDEPSLKGYPCRRGLTNELYLLGRYVGWFRSLTLFLEGQPP